ncbi:hypothetical protein OXYTRIMIC_539 [Oxytricha trifallax]|uniref:Uncharacterized protein n=1 Tax=Oxytricha trifallax TaxID=1172189 RepID=A0A073IB80_9SPIT|nr:hypothetical protein OXYTRIMIC_539 [Oxytricha trifallax]
MYSKKQCTNGQVDEGDSALIQLQIMQSQQLSESTHTKQQDEEIIQIQMSNEAKVSKDDEKDEKQQLNEEEVPVENKRD